MSYDLETRNGTCEMVQILTLRKRNPKKLMSYKWFKFWPYGNETLKTACRYHMSYSKLLPRNGTSEMVQILTLRKRNPKERMSSYKLLLSDNYATVFKLRKRPRRPKYTQQKHPKFFRPHRKHRKGSAKSLQTKQYGFNSPNSERLRREADTSLNQNVKISLKLEIELPSTRRFF